MSEWISCRARFPAVGTSVVYAWPVGKRMTWCAGEVDHHDEGLFIDYGVDAQDIDSKGFWFLVPELPQGDERDE